MRKKVLTMKDFLTLASERYSVRKFKPDAIAPAILLVCAERDRTWKNPLEDGVTSAEQDAAIVATHMMLEAWENGIGSCWVGYFPPSKLAAALALPEDHRPVLLMPIGVPADDAAPSPLHAQCKSLDELVTRR